MNRSTSPPPPFKRVYLLGTGLIGGSLALDLKDSGLVETVVGSDSFPERSESALSIGILDEILPMVPEVVSCCDLVILAVPVINIREILSVGFERDTLVTDAGSVKSDAIRGYREAVAAGKGYRYVPGHPIAGDEKSGPEAARKGLFIGARVILTPVDASQEDVSDISAMWEGVGAKIKIMDPDEHDEVFAWVSHMPHMAAYAIIDSVLAQDPDMVDLSGGGLRDYTRIAASNPRMWADIAVANREKLLIATRGLGDSLNKIISALEEGDHDRLESVFQRIASVRRSLD
ncbi:MAG: prephenate dehydrogenase/arogenate dehydrogenase family protein [bacterium]|nr:prephenate dehydrogenase/arogenate dehydrogenase family protein [bacterium]